MSLTYIESVGLILAMTKGKRHFSETRRVRAGQRCEGASERKPILSGWASFTGTNQGGTAGTCNPSLVPVTIMRCRDRDFVACSIVFFVEELFFEISGNMQPAEILV